MNFGIRPIAKFFGVLRTGTQHAPAKILDSGISSVEKLSRYVEQSTPLETHTFNGIKGVLHNKKIEKQGKIPQDLKVIWEDTFTLSNKNFVRMSDIQRSLIPQELHNTKMGKTFAELAPKIKNLDYEKGFLIDETGKIIAESTTKDATSCGFSTKAIKLANKLIKQNIKVGFLHNHPDEMPISGKDLLFMGDNGFSTIMATMPSGHFSALSKIDTKLSDRFINKAFKEDASQIVNNEILYDFKLALENLNPVEKLRKFNAEQAKRLSANIPSLHYRDNLAIDAPTKINLSPGGDIYQVYADNLGITKQEARETALWLKKKTWESFLLPKRELALG